MKYLVAESARLHATRAWWASVAIIACVMAATLRAPFSAAQAPARSSGGFKLETTAFKPGGDIPTKFTCDGQDVSPALRWTNPPEPPENSRRLAKSFALIVEDPDAPSGTFIHWLVFNIPEETRELPEGISRSRDIIDKNGKKGGIQGQNDFERTGYNGPCPPPGKAHRYLYRLYELNSLTVFNASYTPTKKDFDAAIEGHILAKAGVMGKYQRK